MQAISSLPVVARDAAAAALLLHSRVPKRANTFCPAVAALRGGGILQADKKRTGQPTTVEHELKLNPNFDNRKHACVCFQVFLLAAWLSFHSEDTIWLTFCYVAFERKVLRVTENAKTLNIPQFYIERKTWLDRERQNNCEE